MTISFYPFSSSADVITDWNSLLLVAIRNESTSPPLAARNMAIVHISIFESVNSIEHKYESYMERLDAPAGASPEAAALGAAYECLAFLYPSQIAAFDEALTNSLAAIPPGQARDEGLQFGEQVATAMVAARSADGSSTTVPYIPGTAPGDWRRTPPFFRPPELPQWPYVTPFVMTNGAQFRPPGPPALTSTQYTRDFTLVKQLGGANSTNRTAEQSLIARFWSDFSYTVTPPGHWNQIAQNVATNQNNTLAQNARLFALLNIAMADAGIVAWDAKYVYNFWRPVTAIQEGELDGNPDTVSDPNWLPFLITPSFPEYISGHSTFSSAAATILTAFYGTDRIEFSVGSDGFPGFFRSYDSFAATAEEIGMSRIYGGIHFLSADLDGLEAGQQLGEYVFQNFLRPAPEPALLTAQRSLDDGAFRINLTGTPSSQYVLETSTNLAEWMPVLTNSAPYTFEDMETASCHVRFYRAIAAE